jgi:hypothetical protein
MPTFIRPSRVIVEESGGGLAAAVLIAAAAALGAVTAVIGDIVAGLAAAAALAVLGSLAVLIWVLRRERGTVLAPPAALPARQRAVITAPARPAIEPARSALLGVVISEREEAGR